MKRILFSAFTVFCAYIFANGQDKPKWDVNNNGSPGKEVSFTVNTGTWMNVDISPDGKEIVFDLLGDIYSIPFAGGEAKLLRQGPAFEVQPRYSPDGTRISFTSDAGGGDNIWVMNRDGSAAKQITKETFRLLNNATWTPDGQYLVARKHFTSERSAGAGDRRADRCRAARRGPRSRFIRLEDRARADPPVARQDRGQQRPGRKAPQPQADHSR